MKQFHPWTSIILLSFFAMCSVQRAVASSPGNGPAIKYFPLAAGLNWILQDPVGGAQFSYQVVSASGNTYHIHWITPWNTSDWLLTDEGNQFWMPGYITSAATQPLCGAVF